MIPLAAWLREGQIQQSKPYEKRPAFWKMLDRQAWKPMPGNARDVQPSHIWTPDMPYSYVDNRTVDSRQEGPLRMSRSPYITAPGIDGDWGYDTNMLRQALRNNDNSLGEIELVHREGAPPTRWIDYLKILKNIAKAQFKNYDRKWTQRTAKENQMEYNGWHPRTEKEFWDYINDRGRYNKQQKTITTTNGFVLSGSRPRHRAYGGRLPYTRRRKRHFRSVSSF